jgi:hypothetical protein
MADETHPEHQSLHQRLDDVMAEVKAARQEAQGAHAQAKMTNGRTTRLEDQMIRVRRTLWGKEADGMASDGGLVGYVRTQRRDIRLVGAWVVVGLPLVVAVLLYLD